MFFEFLAATTPLAKASAAASMSPQQIQQLQAQLQSQLKNSLPYVSQTPLQQHAPWLTHTFAGIFIVSAVAFIALLAMQTTKQEGLSGTIGGRVDSAYKGRLGMDGQIARITGMVAVTFVVVATLVSLSGI